jgi:ABC-2 type transport system ATP-binding protein
MVIRKEADDMTYVVQTNKLTKTIGEKNLVTNVSMHVKKGEIYGFLGPNGAGKTTVMKLLTNLWKPTGGSIELFGEKLTSTSYEVLKRMGCMIEFPTFYEHLSGRENLALHCEYMGYYNTGSIENAMELLGLNNTGKKSVREYSLGMKQRLGLARAVLCKPELLILDEPTNGLDPAGIKQIRDLLRMLCTEYDITIIVSSHILSEIESIADTIGVINRGVLVQEIAMQEITERSLAYIELNVVDTRKASYVLSDKIGIDNFKIVEDRIIRIYDGNISVQELSKALALHDVEMTAIGTKSESLEEYFLKLTGGDVRC